MTLETRTRMVTVAQLSEILGVPRTTIWGWCRKSQVPFKRLPGGRAGIRLDLDEIDRALEGGNGKTASIELLEGEQ